MNKDDHEVQKEIGSIISKRMKNNNEKIITGISERMALEKLKFAKTIIQMYVPAQASTEEEVDPI